ncbi:MAG: hypothetical protein ACR2NA_07795 [Solirubrobacterales bacterium]
MSGPAPAPATEIATASADPALPPVVGACRCGHCGRQPLIGEVVAHVEASGWLCALCATSVSSGAPGRRVQPRSSSLQVRRAA